jgi:hypothetical protein
LKILVYKSLTFSGLLNQYIALASQLIGYMADIHEIEHMYGHAYVIPPEAASPDSHHPTPYSHPNFRPDVLQGL